MTTREQAEKAAAEMFPDSATPSTAELLRMGFVRGWETREALLPSVEEVAEALLPWWGSLPGPDESAPATLEDVARAVLARVKGDTPS